MATGKQINQTNNDKSERRKPNRSVRHSIKEVGSECIKIQAIRRPNQGSRKRTKLRGYTKQAASGGIHRRNATSMSIAADHQIRTTTISGGWDYENSETRQQVDEKQR